VLEASTFVPRDVLRTADGRELGVGVRELQVNE
jgi:hypothetical protein